MMLVEKTNNVLPAGTYRFGEDGKAIMTTEVADIDGTLYYFVDGMLTLDAGLVKLGDDYYYINEDGSAATDTMMLVEKTNDLLPAGTYRFAEDGKAIMTTEIADVDGTLYYFVNGLLKLDAGLVKYLGDYYYVDENGVVATDVTMLVTKTNGYFPEDTYTFGEDGKMVINNGIVNGYYYELGIKTAAGLVKIDGEYYYAAEGGKIVTSQSYQIVQTNDLLEAGIYCFDAEGKIIMKSGLYEENGGLYYYEAGRLAKG